MMVLERFKNGFGRKALSAGAIAVTVAAGLAVGVSPAGAADSPSRKELLDSCGWAQRCEFHPQSYATFVGPEHRVGEPLFNCGTVQNSKEIGWSDSTQATNTWGIAVTAGAGFQKVFEVSVQASYQHSWSVQHTTNDSTTVNVPAKSVGWVVRGTGMQRATGWYEIHYQKPFHGNNVWFVKDYQESGFSKDKQGYVRTHDRPMTEQERREHRC